MKPGFAAVIGDVVASREHPAPARLDALVEEALRATNEDVSSVQPLSRTIGDEFQGVYPAVGPALRATLLVRLRLAGEADVRFGIGWGRLYERDAGAAPLRQDGPGWWAAREAVDRLRSMEGARRSPRGRRTRFSIGEAAGPAPEAPARDIEAEDTFLGRRPAPLTLDPGSLVNGLLVCRDELVGAMDARDARILLGLLAGRELAAIASDERISPAAVSQRAIRSGAYAVFEAEALLGPALEG